MILCVCVYALDGKRKGRKANSRVWMSMWVKLGGEFSNLPSLDFLIFSILPLTSLKLLNY